MIITGTKVLRFSSIFVITSMTVITLLMYVGVLHQTNDYLLLYLLTLIGCGAGLFST